MSPEELADLRWLAAEVEIHGEDNVIVYKHKNGVPNGLFALHWISKLLEHIDAQADQIATLKAMPPDIYQVKCKCGNVIEINNGVLYFRIDERNKQIAALKEIAIGERAKTVSLLHPIRAEHLPKSDYAKARQQLEAECPEAMR